jgi:hypothetical protein
MTNKPNATISGPTVTATNDDAALMRQLEEELKNVPIDDDDSISSSSSSASIASSKVHANMLSPKEQEAEGKILQMKKEKKIIP